MVLKRDWVAEVHLTCGRPAAYPADVPWIPYILFVLAQVYPLGDQATEVFFVIAMGLLVQWHPYITDESLGRGLDKS